MNSYKKIYSILVEAEKKGDAVSAATGQFSHTIKKFTVGLSDNQLKAFNYSMAHRDKEGNWRSPTASRALAKKTEE